MYIDLPKNATQQVVSEVVKDVTELGFKCAISKRTDSLKCLLDQCDKLEEDIMTCAPSLDKEEVNKSIKDIESMRIEIFRIMKELDNM